MKIGLTLGKFAPLHKGHEFLIKEACKQLDGGILYVVLYDDIHYRNIPLQTRADWIRKNDAFLGYKIQVILGYVDSKHNLYMRGIEDDGISDITLDLEVKYTVPFHKNLVLGMDVHEAYQPENSTSNNPGWQGIFFGTGVGYSW